APWDRAFCRRRASGRSRPQAEPVGTFPTDISPYGVHDMAGGVREWMADVNGERTWEETLNEHEPVGDTERGASPMRVIRSGNWNATEVYCRSANRSRFFSLVRRTGAGFRVMRPLPAGPRR